MDLNKAIGKRIKQLRKSKGLTQEQLAEKCTVSVHHISGLERGLHSPSLAMLERMAHILGVSIRDFFEPEMQKKKTDLDVSVDILLKYLYRMKADDLKLLTLMARRILK